MIEALVFLLGVPAALIAGAVLDERRKAREIRRKKMEKIALSYINKIKKSEGAWQGEAWQGRSKPGGAWQG
jgi:hypothetical protein